jgi:uncharacterized protein involved in tolerance to divalent cations
VICISTTSNSERVLKKIASEILKKKLSPCTHILKISQSGYVWEGELIYEPEFKLEIKTIESYQKKITTIIKTNHNYKVFELFISEINSVNEEYNKWFDSHLK